MMNVIPLEVMIIVVENQNPLKRGLLGPAINSPRQSTSLTRQMEFKIQVQQVFKCVPRDFSDRTLTNTSEDGV